MILLTIETSINQINLIIHFTITNTKIANNAYIISFKICFNAKNHNYLEGFPYVLSF